MTVVYHKVLKYDGKEWKVAVPVTIPLTTATSGSDVTVFTPTNGFAVIDVLVITNTDPSTDTNVTIKDGTTTLITLPVSAGQTVTVPIKLVVKDKLTINSSATTVTVVGSGEDYQELVE